MTYGNPGPALPVDGYKPEQTELVADPEQPSAGDDTIDMDFGSSEDVEPSVPRLIPSIFNHHVLTASTALKLHFRLIDQPPAEGTAIGVRFTVSKVYLDDVHGAVVVRGHLLAVRAEGHVTPKPAGVGPGEATVHAMMSALCVVGVQDV